jgi:hypothetical protein
LIHVHAPTVEKTEEEKDKCYDDLQRTFERVPRHDVLILGDLNAKIGKEKAYEYVTGKHTLHELHWSTKFNFLLFHEEKYLILIVLLTLNSNM